jgi:ATP-dependent Clp endopeptidase proteolytic subunit ClpP
MSADKFRKELDKHKDAKQINLYINSMGGSVSEGVTIYNQIRRHSAKVTAYIDGFACSIASVIPMAADEVIMGENTMLMIHNPWTFTYGNAKALRKTAEDLDKVRDGCIIPAYKARCGDKLSDEKLIELLDDETFLTAAECLEYGLCDRILTVSNEDKKTEAEDKVKEAMNHAKDGFMDNFIERFGSMVAKATKPVDELHACQSAILAQAIEDGVSARINDANAEKNPANAVKNTADAAKMQQEVKNAAKMQQDDVTDNNDGNINDNGSEPTKEEKTPEPAEDNKAKVNDYFMKLLKGEI